MKTLIVYYSYTGNTEKIALKIKEKLNCDILKLDPIKPYSTDYQTVVEQANNDVKDNYMPKLKDFDINLNDYDKIILGSPVWWYTFASPINTFLNKYDLTNKEIIPFITNGGWIGRTIKNIEKLLPHSKINNAINLKYNETTLLNEEEFNNWLDKLEGW